MNPAVTGNSIADTARCNACHVDLGFHGNRGRKGIDYCVNCHNPNLDNSGRARFKRSEATAAAPFVVESVSANVFIHKIHRGDENSKPYKLGSNRTVGDATPGAEGFADFSKFGYPNKIQNCTSCHKAGTFALPERAGLLPVKQTPFICGPNTATDVQVVDAAGQPVAGEFWCGDRQAQPAKFTPPLKAVCTSCHDTDVAKAHADLNTVGAADPATAIETCAACHGKGREWDALKVHTPVP
jgi:OmcA/MtrC family decaheme c-type cytochrome